MDWIDLAQDRDQWRALVNTAMGSLKYRDFIESLHNWTFLKKGSTP
jgi:hypothetical protein